MPAFEMDQTRMDPSAVWVANMSDFCFDEEPCHERPQTGEGPRTVLSEWSMVKVGDSVAMRMEPFW